MYRKQVGFKSTKKTKPLTLVRVLLPFETVPRFEKDLMRPDNAWMR